MVRFDLMKSGAIGLSNAGSMEEQFKEDDMATVALSVSRQKSERIAVVVREERRAYTFKIAVSMALYACLFFVLAFCGPYVLPAITLFSDAPLTDRQIAASQLLLLSDTVWVAIPVFFLGAILFSLLVMRLDPLPNLTPALIQKLR